MARVWEPLPLLNLVFLEGYLCYPSYAATGKADQAKEVNPQLTLALDEKAALPPDNIPLCFPGPRTPLERKSSSPASCSATTAARVVLLQSLINTEPISRKHLCTNPEHWEGKSWSTAPLKAGREAWKIPWGWVITKPGNQGCTIKICNYPRVSQGLSDKTGDKETAWASYACPCFTL